MQAQRCFQNVASGSQFCWHNDGKALLENSGVRGRSQDLTYERVARAFVVQIARPLAVGMRGVGLPERHVVAWAVSVQRRVPVRTGSSTEQEQHGSGADGGQMVSKYLPILW